MACRAGHAYLLPCCTPCLALPHHRQRPPLAHEHGQLLHMHLLSTRGRQADLPARKQISPREGEQDGIFNPLYLNNCLLCLIMFVTSLV